MRKSMHIWINVMSWLILHIHYFKIIFTTRRPKKWDTDVELYTKIHARPSIVWNWCWEAAVQVGTTFPRTPRTQVAM